MSFINIVKKCISYFLFTKQKEIILIPVSTRFGNHLYFYLHAFVERKKGKNIFINHVEDMNYWNVFFPKLNTFVLKNTEIRFFDKKIKTNSFYQNYGKDFSTEDLLTFLQTNILCEEKNFKLKKSTELIINIRRGDFYTPQHSKMYGFDQVNFIQRAILCLSDYDSIGIVSDDIEWCKKELAFLYNYTTVINFYDQKPLDSFIKICNAKKLIITNSTFSYWGAYINEVINPYCEVVAPSFNASHINNGKMFQNSKKWNLIKVKKMSNV